MSTGIVVPAGSTLRQFEINKRFPDGHPDRAIHAAVELPCVVWVKPLTWTPVQCQNESHTGLLIEPSSLPEPLTGRVFITCECVGSFVE